MNVPEIDNTLFDFWIECLNEREQMRLRIVNKDIKCKCDNVISHSYDYNNYWWFWASIQKKCGQPPFWKYIREKDFVVYDHLDYIEARHLDSY